MRFTKFWVDYQSLLTIEKSMFELVDFDVSHRSVGVCTLCLLQLYILTIKDLPRL
jgi:hypothetical protein